VAEAYSYPPARNECSYRINLRNPDGARLVDKKTSSIENLTLLAGWKSLGGHLDWRGSQSFGCPVKDGEDKPAGPPQVLATAGAIRHSRSLNTFTWGPMALYGFPRVLTHSRVGKP